MIENYIVWIAVGYCFVLMNVPLAYALNLIFEHFDFTAGVFLD